MNESEWNKATLGYGATFVAEYNFKTTLFLQSGVGVENIAYDDGDINNVFYAQIPIHIGYRYILENRKVCFIQAGPTFGLGMFGPKINWDCAEGSQPCKPDNYFDSDGKRFDLGLGGRVGIEILKFQISVGANYGVLEATTWGGHNLTVNLGVAYMF